MAESRESIPLTVARADRIFPTLSEAQMQRLASHGTARSVRSGEILVELGDKDIPVFLVTSGELEILRPSLTTQETLIRVVGPRQFTGEINTLSGRRAFARIRTRARIRRSSKSRGLSLVALGTDRCRVKRHRDGRFHFAPR